ncbi:hypothetical protein GSI_02684 [Ganoderma sinense ZZ0214-1]|uniref:Uncharacterized protein n=1 Tax=Ganoderma sinense ZZ0214-1 TaxID=1077348 RepID=A0A2G8SM99_9APHY|nr:hypothetical protein GSI_02684 [Ganoderma sinense ZZ0214-1]
MPSFNVSRRKYSIAIHETGSHMFASFTPASAHGEAEDLQSFIRRARFAEITELELLFHDPKDPLVCHCNGETSDTQSHKPCNSTIEWLWPTRNRGAVSDAVLLCKNVGKRLHKVTIHTCLPNKLVYFTHSVKVLIRRHCPNVHWQKIKILDTSQSVRSSLNAECVLVEKLHGLTIQG